MQANGMSAKPTVMVQPKLWGVPGSLVFCVRRDAEGRLTNSTKMIEGTSDNDAAKKGEAECNELLKDPTVVRVIWAAVISEGRRLDEKP